MKANTIGSNKMSVMNWAGNVDVYPDAVHTPHSEEELLQLLANSKTRIRVKGSGHSFTPLIDTENKLISLEQMPGDLIRVDTKTDIATIQTGASLNALSRAMQKQNLGFKNLGDIDVQSFAGATATATHGTGQGFPCLSAEIEGLKLVTANGELLAINKDENSDLLPAARVSLGALGIMMEADVAVRPAYKLHRKTFIKPLKQTLEEAGNCWDNHRNFEFFYLPYCDYAFNISHDLSEAEDYADHGDDDDAAVGQLKLLRNLTSRLPWLRRKLMNLVASRHKTEEMIGTSWELLANVRNTRFKEMEYHIPARDGIAAFEEIVETIERNRPDVFFPIEVRKTAGDKNWLSPFQHGERISIAIHTPADENNDWFYTLVEPVFRKYSGRPHWGKLHSLTHDALQDLYPDFQKFLDVRRKLDPQGRFLNPHTATLWGEVL